MKREFGCAAGVSQPGVQSCPVQSIKCSGGSAVFPSHQTSPSSVNATFVKIEFAAIACIAFGFDFHDVPGATPKNPVSGLIARSRPSAPGQSQAMSSPTSVVFQPASRYRSGGTSIARFVLPQALGNAAVRYVFRPSGASIPRISMCSASQPFSRAMCEAMRSARHFLPNSAFPP